MTKSNTPNTDTVPDVTADSVVAIAALGQSAVTPIKLDRESIYLVPGVEGPAGEPVIVDTLKYEPAAPTRKRATRTVTNSQSFADYVQKHGIPDATEVYADSTTSKVVGVIDAHEQYSDDVNTGVPGYGEHVVTLDLKKTSSWNEWLDLGTGNRFIPQIEFADFIETHSADIATPAPAVMLDIAQTFQGHVNVDWEAGEQTQSGRRTIGWKETESTKAGSKGELEVPREIELVLRPYVDGPLYYLTALFRYRLNGGNIKLGISIVQPEKVLEQAFADVIDQIRNGKKPTVGIVDGDEVVGKDGFAGIGEHPIFFGKP